MTIRNACGILTVFALAALSPLWGQVKDADVAALLSNDDAVASLKQQLAAKQIGNLDYTRSVQELNRARNQIVARYNRAEQRELTALYRAALRDKQTAAIEAKRKADAEAKAQAAADVQARKEAAQAAAQEAVEVDAQTYTRLALRHDELLMHSSELQGITDAEKAEMPRIRKEGDAIKAKYAAGGASTALSPAFEKRLAELSQEKIAPARQSWIASGFAPAKSVTAAYFDDTKRLAALLILERLLEEKAGQPQVPATTDKLQAYRAAIQIIDTADKGESQAPAERLTRDARFRYEVLHQFATQFQGLPQPPFTEDTSATASVEDFTKRNFYLIGGVAGLLAAALIYLRFGGRGKKTS